MSTFLVTDTEHHHKKPWLMCPVMLAGRSRWLLLLQAG